MILAAIRSARSGHRRAGDIFGRATGWCCRRIRRSKSESWRCPGAVPATSGGASKGRGGPIRQPPRPPQVAGELRQALARIDRNIPIVEMTILSDQVDHSVAHEVLVSRLSIFFAVLALLLACIGLYGVMSYNVVRRANEIGIRMALGAELGSVLSLVLRETLVLLAVGIAIGVPATLASTHLVESQLSKASSSASARSIQPPSLSRCSPSRSSPSSPDTCPRGVLPRLTR